jgi:hypothetical protein
MEAVDVIGDIHGHADKLEALLRRLGYTRKGDAWRHPERTAVFVGDFIDRGPAQLRSVDIARRMVDAGTALAVMGNHELNAIAWHTPDPGNPGEYLRPRNNATPSIFKAVEALTKGIEIPLPSGHAFADKDGHTRTRVRVRWWDGRATTYRTAAMMTRDEASALPDLPIPDHARIPLDDTPVFFGHYWLTGSIVLQSPTCACLDYSAGKGGPLVAYRFDGERQLSRGKFVWVD